MIAEVWTGLKCASGTRASVLGQPGTAEAQWQIDNSHVLALTVERSGPGASALRLNRIIRLTTGAGDVSEWVITDITDARDSTFTLVRCAAPHILLANVLVRHKITGGRSYYNNGLVNCRAGNYIATFALPSLVAEGMTWVSAGTIEATQYFDMGWERWTVLELLNAIATRTNTEFVFRRDGDTGYKIDLLEEQGSTAAQLLVRSDKNLAGITRERRSTPLRTVAVPLGSTPDGDDNEPATLAYADLEVTNVVGGVLTVADPAGNGDMIAYDDQLNGLFVLKANASLTEITDSAVTGQTITVASVTGIATSDHIEIRADSNGALLHELTNPSAVTLYGRVVGRPEDANARGERNHVSNPFAATWPTQPAAIYWGQAQGAAAATSVVMDGLPAGLVVPASAQISTAFTSLLGASPTRVTAQATVAASGTVTLLTAAALTANDNDWIRLSASYLPTGYTMQAGASGTHTVPLSKRDTSLAAATLVALTSGTHTSAYNCTLDGLTEGNVIEVGDIFTLSGTSRMVVRGDTADANGIVQIALDGTITAADNATCTITRVAHAVAEGGANGILLGAVPTTAYLRTPAYTVRYSSDMPAVWAAVRYSYIPTATVTLTAAGTRKPPTLEIINADTDAVLASVQDDDRTITSGVETDVTLRTTTTLAANTNLALRIIPVLTAESPMDPAITVRWVMLYVGADPGVPPVNGSHANTLWHLANTTLLDQSDEPITYTATVADLREMGITDEEIVLGGTARVVDTELGIDTTLRVVAMQLDLTNPVRSQITFSRLSPRLTRKLAAQRKKFYALVNIATQDATEVELVPVQATPEPDPISAGYGGEIPKGDEDSYDPNDEIPLSKPTGTRSGRYYL